MKKLTHMSPLVIVDTDLPKTKVRTQKGKYYKDESRNAIEKAVYKWVSDKLSTIATQSDNEMSATTDSVTSEPSSDNADDLGKTIMTALLQFHTKF